MHNYPLYELILFLWSKICGSEFLFVYFSHIVPGYLINTLDNSWYFMFGKFVLCPFLQHFLSQCLSNMFQSYNGCHLLSPGYIGNSKNTTLLDVWMPQQNILYLQGIDFVSTVFNNIHRQPPFHFYHAIFIKSHVSCWGISNIITIQLRYIGNEYFSAYFIFCVILQREESAKLLLPVLNQSNEVKESLVLWGAFQ